MADGVAGLEGQVAKEFVAVDVGGDVKVHLPDTTGNYATLCGMDGDDPHSSVGQKMAELPKRAKVDCVTCWNIWKLCRDYRAGDFKVEG